MDRPSRSSMNNFEHRVLRIEPIKTAVQRSALNSSVCVKCTSNNCCGVCSSSVPAMLYYYRYLLRFLILQRCSRRQNNISKAGRPGSSEVPRNPLTRRDVSSIPANGIFLTKKLKNKNKNVQMAWAVQTRR